MKIIRIVRTASSRRDTLLLYPLPVLFTYLTELSCTIEVDECCQSAVGEFNAWLKQDELSGSVVGPGSIVFPEFAPDMAREAMEIGGLDKGDEYAVMTSKALMDFYGYETKICAAYGSYHQPSTAPLDDKKDDEMDMELVIPDNPMYPHCASSHAYLVNSCISTFTKIKEGTEKKRKRAKIQTVVSIEVVKVVKLGRANNAIQVWVGRLRNLDSLLLLLSFQVIVKLAFAIKF